MVLESVFIINNILFFCWCMILVVVIMFIGVFVCLLIIGKWWMFFFVINVNVLNMVFWWVICIGVLVIILFILRWLLCFFVIILLCKLWLVIILIRVFCCVISNEDMLCLSINMVVFWIDVVLLVLMGNFFKILLSGLYNYIEFEDNVVWFCKLFCCNFWKKLRICGLLKSVVICKVVNLKIKSGFFIMMFIG